LVMQRHLSRVHSGLEPGRPDREMLTAGADRPGVVMTAHTSLGHVHSVVIIPQLLDARDNNGLCSCGVIDR